MPTTEKMPVLTRLKRARDQFHDLTGLEALAVSGLTKIDGGWQVEVDAVEIPRIATYRVTTDESGDVTTYTRLRHLIPTPTAHAA